MRLDDPQIIDECKRMAEDSIYFVINLDKKIDEG